MTNTIPSFIVEKKSQIELLARKYRVRTLSVFGSQISGKASETSDVDFLAEFEKDADLFDLIGLSKDLEELLGKKVDIGSASSLHWTIKESVLKEALPL